MTIYFSCSQRKKGEGGRKGPLVRIVSRAVGNIKGKEQCRTSSSLTLSRERKERRRKRYLREARKLDLEKACRRVSYFSLQKGKKRECASIFLFMCRSRIEERGAVEEKRNRSFFLCREKRGKKKGGGDPFLAFLVRFLKKGRNNFLGRGKKRGVSIEIPPGEEGNPLPVPTFEG